ncbi:MAG: 30S ribosomal protein S1, partial [Clostridia bacterium]|nr:30S ribosomal protein S1 [Clostridia bacterium]
MTQFLPEGRLINTPENIEAQSCIDSLEKAMREGRILESRAVLCDNRHNIIVNLGCMKGIIRREDSARGIPEGTV